ncbi:unnamed protein product [Parascedosporium putredinis]|uniref:Copper homeostasis protein cutC homolog n=1 Tax=Parascedosporium putredinis TaxID=1442378 RepID=A0A9P1GUJ6_9PEZI|nr:unnamed protein product [Parascedosporium putredinis]CAI7987376.1 unnamed protein product [Parascedosporium putredinis]
MGLNLNLSASINVFKLITRPYLCLPHCTVPTFTDLPIPLDSVLKQQGKKVDIRAVVLDKDDCFAIPDSNEVYQPYKQHFEALKKAYPGRRLLIVSNTSGATSWDPQRKMAQALEEETGIPVLTHSDKKPGCGSEVMEYFRKHPETGVTSPSQIAVVGDRLTTDIMMANMMGAWGFGSRTVLFLWLRKACTSARNAMIGYISSLVRGISTSFLPHLTLRTLSNSLSAYSTSSAPTWTMRAGLLDFLRPLNVDTIDGGSGPPIETTPLSVPGRRRRRRYRRSRAQAPRPLVPPRPSADSPRGPPAPAPRSPLPETKENDVVHLPAQLLDQEALDEHVQHHGARAVEPGIRGNVLRRRVERHVVPQWKWVGPAPTPAAAAGEEALRRQRQARYRSQALWLHFHRAFDSLLARPECASVQDHIDALLACGFDAVLTSGGPGNASDNLARLGDLIRAAAGRLDVLIGGGVRASGAAALLEAAGAANRVWLHSSCIGAGETDEVDAGEVAALVEVIGEAVLGSKQG